MTVTLDIQARASQSMQPSGLCVLVVEDDEADVYLISRALAGHPAIGDIVYASDGVQALNMVDSGAVDPDLAFIDLHMPRKNGFSLLTAFACDNERSFPMVVLTSSVATTDAIRSRLRGAIRVITKPDSVEAMQSALASAISAVCPKRLSISAMPAPEPTASRFSRSAKRTVSTRFSASSRQTTDRSKKLPDEAP